MRNISFIVFIFILLTGCHKDEPVTYDNFSQTTLDYVYFKTGSFWIYEDSITGTFDSIIIDETTFEKRHHEQISSHDNTYDYDYLNIEYKENNNKLKFESMSGNSALSRHYYYDSIWKSYPIYYETRMTVGLIDSCHNNFYPTDCREIVNYFDQYTVLGNTFDNVYLIRIHDTYLNWDIEYYLARKNGIIKKRILSSDTTITWNLINWNIYQ